MEAEPIVAVEEAGSCLPPQANAREYLHPPREGYLVFGRTQEIRFASDSLRAVLQLPSTAKVVGESLLPLLASVSGPDPQTSASVVQWLARQTAEGSGTELPPFALLTAPGASTVYISLDPVGDGYWVATFRDVTSTLQAESEMVAIAARDHLTGIGNRAFFENRCDGMLARLAAREVDSATVLFLDLDRFKLVNDTLGHAIGDALLQLVSERLKKSVREADTVARLGGDEFAILLVSATGREAAAALATRIIDMIQRPYLIDGHVVHVGASIGIAMGPEDGSTREALVRSADLALYHSKATGRGVFHFFDASMQQRAQRRHSLEVDLRKALVLRQFELHYQPQIDVESGAVIGLEGLLRWHHPVRGMVLPGDFIPLAEELGLAVPIGEWVLRTACREAMRWPESVTIAVNVSPLQFGMGNFADSVQRALGASGLPGHRLEIEVTESILLRDGQTVLATLQALRAIGVRVAMDRFGIGIASLSQLVNFPFDKIKIDRSLITLNQDDVKKRAIVCAISALGHSLGISTLAEGVETAEHLAHVREGGCHSVQGFYYSQAVPSGEVADMVSHLFPARAQAKALGSEGEA